MLQTPAKTPRKRVLSNAGAGRTATARVLFPGRSAIDETMPSPSKARKSKYPDPFSLAEEGDDEGSSSKIEIYTDSKERVPVADEDPNNPFLSRNAAKSNKRQKKTHTTKHDAKIEEAVKQDKGMVYVL